MRDQVIEEYHKWCKEKFYYAFVRWWYQYWKQYFIGKFDPLSFFSKAKDIFQNQETKIFKEDFVIKPPDI